MLVTTTGTVTKLKLNDFRGFVEMQPDGETGIALFIIWLGDEARGPSALYTSELTTAMVRGLRVDIVHEFTSAFIDDLIIHAP